MPALRDGISGRIGFLDLRNEKVKSDAGLSYLPGKENAKNKDVKKPVHIICNWQLKLKVTLLI